MQRAGGKYSIYINYKTQDLSSVDIILGTVDKLYVGLVHSIGSALECRQDGDGKGDEDGEEDDGGHRYAHDGACSTDDESAENRHLVNHLEDSAETVSH